LRVNGRPQRTIWPGSDGASVEVIDQTRLPHEFAVARLDSVEGAARAISAMLVRGAPLIGATAAYGIWLAMLRDPSDASLRAAAQALLSTRPTAVNLRWAVERMTSWIAPLPAGGRAAAALARAAQVCDEDVAINRGIGAAGLPLIRAIAARKPAGGAVNVLTHCNAGWLATVDVGTATAPIYEAHDAGVLVHVWVDETRPRNQGASLTAWELLNHGVAHTVISDNAGGHLMQRGQVDMVIVGTDRTSATGDVCNKIGTYLKALAARDCGVPFYAAVPSPSIDWGVRDGLREIPIENRPAREVTHISGRLPDGAVATVAITPQGSAAANPAFDVTPARLVTGLITERGVAEASEAGLRRLFPERAPTINPPHP
jgi:methylthioribose-1-phosphate isomerase